MVRWHETKVNDMTPKTKMTVEIKIQQKHDMWQVDHNILIRLKYAYGPCI
jgi:hypothetical protein